MKDIKLITSVILIILLSFLGLKLSINFNNKKNYKDHHSTVLKESIRILNECFDLENKNKRQLYKSIELIEYCLKEYGYKK